MNLKVMSFNLRTHTEEDKRNAWPYRIDAVAQTIDQAEASVIGTQEGLASMLIDLDNKMAGYERIGESRHSYRADEHCAIYHQTAMLDLVSHDTFWLSETPDRPGSIGWEARWPRICTWGHYKSKSDPDKQFYLYNVHLDNIGEIARLEGLKLVWHHITLMREKEKLPFIIMGDFNTTPQSAPIQFLEQAGLASDQAKAVNVYQQLVEQPVGRTYHGFKGGTDGEPIDYIFVSNDFIIKETEIIRDKIEDRYPSDHFPIVCTLQL